MLAAPRTCLLLPTAARSMPLGQFRGTVAKGAPVWQSGRTGTPVTARLTGDATDRRHTHHDAPIFGYTASHVPLDFADGARGRSNTAARVPINTMAAATHASQLPSGAPRRLALPWRRPPSRSPQTPTPPKSRIKAAPTTKPISSRRLQRGADATGIASAHPLKRAQRADRQARARGYLPATSRCLGEVVRMLPGTGSVLVAQASASIRVHHRTPPTPSAIVRPQRLGGRARRE